MTWESISAISDLVAAVGVIASLIYVARQIRQNSTLLEQNTRLAKASRLYELNDLYTAPYALVAQDPELARLYRRAKSGESLGPDEFQRFEAILHIHVAWLEDWYFQAESGLDSDNWSGTEALPNLAPAYKPLFSSEAARRGWSESARSVLSHEFHDVFSTSVLGVAPES